MKNIYYIFIIWNIAVFVIYGIDKRKSLKSKWRIKEATLIGLAFIMGGLGALIGMSVFHHKTKKLKFRLLIPLAIIFNALVVIATYYLMQYQ